MVRLAHSKPSLPLHYPAVWFSVWLLLLCGTANAVNTADLQRPLSADDTRHLLARTGIGVAPADYLNYRNLTRQEAIDTLISGFTDKPVIPMPGWVNQPVPLYHARQDMNDNERAVFNNQRDAELGQLRAWWVMEMLQTTSPQTERMVLFWHDIFATSYYGTGRQSLAMARQNQTFRELGMGGWAKLLKAMIRDPALLAFLNAGSNHKDSPNENLARELLELFTLGEGNFDEKLVKEAARTLTGHNTNRLHNLAFQFQSWKHDHGAKTLFGTAGKFRGDDLIDAVLAQPIAGHYLAERFWHAFVADTPADEAWVASMAHTFQTSGFDIASLYRSVLESDAFWQVKHRGALIKSPVDLVAGTARSLEYPKHRWSQMAGWQSALGMALFAPPNVSGWKEGGAFVTPGLLLKRFELLDELIAPPGNALATSTGMMMEDSSAAQLDIRVAAENYRGSVEYQVSAHDDNNRIWQSDVLALHNGRDTERDGRTDNLGELNWATVSLVVPQSDMDRATHVEVAFLNDAAGPDGDRNLFVEGIAVNQQWISGTQANQISECPPALAANAWKLYCAGAVRFSLQSENLIDEDTDPLPAWRASAVHVGWANDNAELDRQTLYLTLDHVTTPTTYFHTLQFSVRTQLGEPAKLGLEAFGCWPACIDEWPECAWQDVHFHENRALSFVRRPVTDTFWQSDQASACHYNSLRTGGKSLVDTLWRSTESLIREARSTRRAEQFDTVLQKLSRRLAQDVVALRDTPYGDGSSMIVIDPVYAADQPIPSRLPDISAAVNSEKQLQGLLHSVKLPVQYLLMPIFDEPPAVDMTVDNWVVVPEFQLK